MREYGFVESVVRRIHFAHWGSRKPELEKRTVTRVMREIPRLLGEMAYLKELQITSPISSPALGFLKIACGPQGLLVGFVFAEF